MLINEVQYIVGLSKKTIRFYEDQGLISPNRDQGNDYRIYSDEDVMILKKIKFLRELGVTIKDIKAIFNHDISLNDCLQEQMHKINKEKDKYDDILKICENVIALDKDIEDVDIREYLQNINILNKEGFSMRDVKTNKSKKIIEACISSLIFGLLFIFLGYTVTYFQMTQDDKMPLFFFIFVMGVLLLPVIAIIYNLIIRIKEILGGEEDEASKY